MTRNLCLLLLYFTGFAPVIISIVQTVSRNYYLILTKKTWPVAQNYCRTMYTDLAIILNDADHLQLQKEGKRKGLMEAAWVGMYNDASSWRWSLYDFQLKDSTFINWAMAEPDNYLGRDSCVTIMSIYGFWEDQQCTGLKPFICFNANFTGADKFIGVSSPQLSWLEARAYCRTHHTDLASALNSSDNAFLTHVSSIQGDSWIGLYRDMWKWADGSNATNLSWYPGQPNNNWGSENCVPVFKYLFIDEECENLHYFFCYTDAPVKIQTVRVQVKSDGSVFDPDAQAAILEQMKQKLEANGMLKNLTVAWKVQSDGNIFHKKNKNDV